MRPLHRILISFGVSLLTFLFIRKNNVSLLMMFMLLWDVFSLSYIITSWIVFFHRSPTQIRTFAKKEDGSRVFVFVIVLVASFASMFNVLLLMLSKEVSDGAQILYIPAIVVGMLFAWLMVHSTFAFHFAHMYYGDDEGNPKKHAEGLNFPEEKNPDYLDFAYFAFVIGMTFQVSDVEITSRQIRRVALVHGLLSFGLNTFVVALTINLIAGLRG